MFSFIIIFIYIVLPILQLKISEAAQRAVQIFVVSMCCSFLYLSKPSPLSVQTESLSLTSDFILAEGKEMEWVGLKQWGHRWEAQAGLEVQVFLYLFLRGHCAGLKNPISTADTVHPPNHPSPNTASFTPGERELRADIGILRWLFLIGTQWSCVWWCSG